MPNPLATAQASKSRAWDLPPEEGLPGGFEGFTGTLFERAIEHKVAFVPGNPFYVGEVDSTTLRLNFSCVDEETIEIGTERLGDAFVAMPGSRSR